MYVSLCLLHSQTTNTNARTNKLQGARALAQALQGNTKIEELDMSGNAIYDEGAQVCFLCFVVRYVFCVLCLCFVLFVFVCLLFVCLFVCC